MKTTRSSRINGVFLALASMLFMQLLLAGYVCPKANAAVSATKIPAPDTIADAMNVDMPDCEQMDIVQPSLCHASAYAVQQSLDKHEMPAVQPFIPTTISLVLVYLEVPISANPIALNATTQSGIPAPPLAIRHCCFRI
jgi:hypothetical protein